MKDTLDIGRTADGHRPFTLPVEFVMNRYAVVAISGYGKTILGTVMAEELIKLNQPFIALDVVGNWWGLRVGQGKHPGFPVVVIGGRHGDVPLHADKGREYAHALTTGGLFAVIDLSTTPLDDRWRFTADFCSELLMIQPESPRHVFFEELKELASQQPRNKWHKRCTDAIDSFCTIGRNYGYGYTVIGQRTAIMAKGPLNQAGALFAMRLQGTQDIDSIMEWIENNGPDLEPRGGAKVFKKALAKLEKGEAFYVDPSAKDPLVKVEIRERETVHPAEAMRVNPKLLKSATMTDVKGFVDQLTKAFHDAGKERAVPVGPAWEGVRTGRTQSRKPNRAAEPQVNVSEKAAFGAVEKLEKANGRIAELDKSLRAVQVRGRALEGRLAKFKEAMRPQYEALRALFEEDEVTVGPAAIDNGRFERWLKKAGETGCRRVLETLLEHTDGLAWAQAATLSGLGPNGSQMRKYKGWFRRNLLVDEYAKEGVEFVKLRPIP